MKTIIVKNQTEWDALPEKFEEGTAVYIYSDPGVPLVIKRSPENATVEAWGNATVRAWGNATVRAWGNATVEASEDATVEASENAAVRAWGNATVEAGGNAAVRAWGNAAVRAWGNATVEAWGNATVRAWGNATLHLFSDQNNVEIFHFVVVVCQDCKPTIKRHGTGVTVVRTKTFKHSVNSFCEIYGDGSKLLTLYKSVRPDTLCDHYMGKIKYEGVVECPDWDPNPERQCGGGLHLSPTPEMALSYHNGKILKCEVDRKDIVVYAEDITKVRCRKVTVIGEWKP